MGSRVEEVSAKATFSFPVAEGGGVMSSANWVKSPQEADRLKGLRSHFLSLVGFTPDKQTALRDALVCFLAKQGCVCCKAVLPYQPFLLDAWQALSSFTSDIDSDLPRLLSEGVPTGIISPIVPSKVWDNASDFDGDVGCDLLVHSSPWKSAADNVPLARSLMMQDVEAGFAYVLCGEIEEAKQKWGAHVAAGRLGLVQVEARNLV